MIFAVPDQVPAYVDHRQRDAALEFVATCVADTVHARVVMGDRSRAEIVRTAQTTCLRYPAFTYLGMPPKNEMDARVDRFARQRINMEILR